MTKTKRKRTGSSGLGAVLLALAAIAEPGSAAPARDKAPPPPIAIIAGTVFRSPGFALPGAEVTVVPKSAESGGVKFKKIQTVSSRRGEWAVRVPAVPMEYTIYVKCSGYQSQENIAEIEGQQRRELNFVLEPATPSREGK
jgi:hypothetical protein